MSWISPYTPSRTPQDDSGPSILKWVFNELLRVAKVVGVLATPKVAKVYRASAPTTKSLSGSWQEFDIFDTQQSENNIDVDGTDYFFTVKDDGPYLVTFTSDCSVNANSVFVSFGVSINDADPDDSTVTTLLFDTLDVGRQASFAFPIILSQGDNVRIKYKDPEAGTDTLAIRDAICSIVGV